MLEEEREVAEATRLAAAEEEANNLKKEEEAHNLEKEEQARQRAADDAAAAEAAAEVETLNTKH